MQTKIEKKYFGINVNDVTKWNDSQVGQLA